MSKEQCYYQILKNNFSPKAVAKLMGDARELITMDVYGDNGNIIAEEIPPELLSYIEEVLPEKKKDNIENVLQCSGCLNEKVNSTF